jgi:hypothetical protein
VSDSYTIFLVEVAEAVSILQLLYCFLWTLPAPASMAPLKIAALEPSCSMSALHRHHSGLPHRTIVEECFKHAAMWLTIPVVTVIINGSDLAVCELIVITPDSCHCCQSLSLTTAVVKQSALLLDFEFELAALAQCPLWVLEHPSVQQTELPYLGEVMSRPTLRLRHAAARVRRAADMTLDRHMQIWALYHMHLMIVRLLQLDWSLQQEAIFSSLSTSLATQGTTCAQLQRTLESQELCWKQSVLYS